MGEYQFRIQTRKRLASNDVALVRAEARIVLEIVSAEKFSERWNPNGRLSIIAIIGPTEDGEQYYDSALLCEIGIGKTRPYNEAKKPKQFLNIGETKCLPARRKWFYLSTEQYILVAPRIFKIMQDLTDVCVGKWQTKGGFEIPTPRNFYTFRSKKILKSRWNTPRSWQRGCRFSVRKDEMFLGPDIFYCEYHSEKIANDLGGLARFIDKRLRNYRQNGYTRDFCSLKGVIEISEILRRRLRVSLAPEHLVQMLEFLPHGKKNLFWQPLCELIANISKWDGSVTLRKKMANLALKNPSSRLDKIELSIVSEIRPGKKMADIWVFEIFPTPTSEKEISETIELVSVKELEEFENLPF
jgi:hypothetical protein